MLLAELVDASAAVAATPARNAKIGALAELLGRAGPGEVAPVVSWLSGELTQRQIGVGYALLREPPPAAPRRRRSRSPRSRRAFGAIGAMTGPGSVRGAARRARGAAGARDARPSRSSSRGCCSATCARARSRA